MKHFIAIVALFVSPLLSQAAQFDISQEGGGLVIIFSDDKLEFKTVIDEIKSFLEHNGEKLRFQQQSGDVLRHLSRMSPVALGQEIHSGWNRIAYEQFFRFPLASNRDGFVKNLKLHLETKFPEADVALPTAMEEIVARMIPVGRGAFVLSSLLSGAPVNVVFGGNVGGNNNNAPAMAEQRLRFSIYADENQLNIVEEGDGANLIEAKDLQMAIRDFLKEQGEAENLEQRTGRILIETSRGASTTRESIFQTFFMWPNLKMDRTTLVQRLQVFLEKRFQPHN
jgi:hypothetical protein